MPSTGTGGQKAITQVGQTAGSQHASNATKSRKGGSDPRPAGKISTRSEG